MLGRYQYFEIYQLDLSGTLLSLVVFGVTRQTHFLFGHLVLGNIRYSKIILGISQIFLMGKIMVLSLWRFPEMGVPPKNLFTDGFSTTHHPAIGVGNPPLTNEETPLRHLFGHRNLLTTRLGFLGQGAVVPLPVMGCKSFHKLGYK